MTSISVKNKQDLFAKRRKNGVEISLLKFFENAKSTQKFQISAWHHPQYIWFLKIESGFVLCPWVLIYPSQNIAHFTRMVLILW